MMKVSSVRLGFANNSSSTHSILVGSGPMDEIGSSNGPYSFGWDGFVLSSAESKVRYVASWIATFLRGELRLPESEAVRMASVLTGDDDVRWSDAYVDGQSLLALPVDGAGRLVVEFVHDLVKYVRRPDVVITGGNDNYDDEGGDWVTPVVSGRAELTSLLRPFRGCPLRARKDGQWWVLFNERGGDKVRFSFDADAPAYLRSSFPELVDVKITDFCPHGCAFCYQGSTLGGRHADVADVLEAAEVLGSLGVFEAAIGGGEPTLHPSFPGILGLFRDNGVVPNFTTFNMNWSRNACIAKAVRGFCGSFAVSSYDENTLSLLKEWNQENDPWLRDSSGVCGTLQLTEGTMPLFEFGELARRVLDMGIPLTVLGYKTVGRGAGYLPHDWSGFVDLLKEMGVRRLGADSVLVRKYGDEFVRQLGVDRSLMVGAEGAFSMYVDAVRMEAGPSSFCDGSEMRSYERGGLRGLIECRFPYV